MPGPGPGGDRATATTTPGPVPGDRATKTMMPCPGAGVTERLQRLCLARACGNRRRGGARPSAARSSRGVPARGTTCETRQPAPGPPTVASSACPTCTTCHGSTAASDLAGCARAGPPETTTATCSTDPVLPDWPPGTVTIPCATAGEALARDLGLRRDPGRTASTRRSGSPALAGRWPGCEPIRACRSRSSPRIWRSPRTDARGCSMIRDRSRRGGGRGRGARGPGPRSADVGDRGRRGVAMDRSGRATPRCRGARRAGAACAERRH